MKAVSLLGLLSGGALVRRSIEASTITTTTHPRYAAKGRISVLLWWLVAFIQ